MPEAPSQRSLATASTGGESAAAAELPHLAVIGAGRAGRSLARAAERAGLDFELAGREDALACCRRSEIALLCVPDAQIAPASATVAAAIPPLGFVGHVSGATGLDALFAARQRGAEVFSLHPLQTLPDGEADLSGAACAISGSSRSARELIRALAEALGMRPFEIREEDRAIYHAAACVASNFLVALAESAARLLAEAGGEEPRELLAPLVLRTAANWSERGAEALTGPIARGDEETVQRHLAALEQSAPELVPLYTVLASRTRALALGDEAARAATAAGETRG